MSALPPKADMCSATLYVRFVPIADIPTSVSLSSVRRLLLQSVTRSQKWSRYRLNGWPTHEKAA